MAGAGNVVVLGPNEVAAQATTTTTVAPPPRPVAPRPKPVVRAAAPRPRATTTTAKPRSAPAPKPAAAPPSPDRTEAGKASWYDHEAGVCAHKTLPFGTVLTVTNTANGRSTTCVVRDRGPYVEGWVVDLNPREFEQLAPRSAGVITVRLTW
jgi:rare lipoprotein A (peptidoglycan hydrolase)